MTTSDTPLKIRVKKIKASLKKDQQDFDPAPLLWNVRTEEEAHQLLKNNGGHFPSAEPFNEGISASITSAFSQVMQ